MVLSSMLTSFRISNMIVERSNGSLQQHPKAHYIGFRTCEILKDLGLGHHLEERFESIDHWSHFNYKSQVIGGTDYGRVNHFDWFCRKNGINLEPKQLI